MLNGRFHLRVNLTEYDAEILKGNAKTLLIILIMLFPYITILFPYSKPKAFYKFVGNTKHLITRSNRYQ